MKSKNLLPCSQKPSAGPLFWGRRIQSVTSQTYFSKIQFIVSSHLCLVFLSVFFPSGFPDQNPTYIPRLPICPTCPANLILLGLIILIIFGEECKFWGARGSVVGWGTMLQAWRVAVSIPDEVTGFLNWPNPSSRTMALRSTQPLTEMSTRNLPGG
jgi:hypothetical protein